LLLAACCSAAAVAQQATPPAPAWSPSKDIGNNPESIRKLPRHPANLLNKKKPNKKPPRKTLIHQAVAVSKAVLAVPLAVRPLAPSRGTLEKAQARVLLPAQGAVE
jgi:hypothetical protein